MVQFNFKLPDCEAQNLFFILQHAIEDAKTISALGVDSSGRRWSPMKTKGTTMPKPSLKQMKKQLAGLMAEVFDACEDMT